MWQTIFDRMLRDFTQVGQVTVTYPDGTSMTYGPGPQTAPALTITDTATLRGLVLNTELTLGEAYMDGRLSFAGDDIGGFLEFATRNARASRNLWWYKTRLTLRRLSRRFAQWNPMPRARANVAHHYDLSAELYDLFLDEDRQYSCAYFRTPGMSLEAAQDAKKAHIAAKLRLEPGQRVLDIGCGWGGLALSLARDHGVEVLGVTLSEEQHRFACDRAKAAGLETRVRFQLRDYRTVTDRFDRIVSVGMFEHVGVPHYGEYFTRIHDLLSPDGVALVHTIGRGAAPGSTSPWIAKYIFPGGYVPAMSEMTAAIEKSGLLIADLEVWRLHYAETLRHWHDRFVAREDAARALYDDRFCRMWRYYLKASEHAFRHAGQVVFQVQLAKRQDAVPLTRDYLYAGAAAPRRLDAAE